MMVNLTKRSCFTSDDGDDDKEDDDEGDDGKKGLTLISDVLGINNQQLLFFRAIAFFLASQCIAFLSYFLLKTRS